MRAARAEGDEAQVKKWEAFAESLRQTAAPAPAPALPGIPVIGWEAEMAQLTREDAFKVYHDYYAPHNAILVVAGDITMAVYSAPIFTRLWLSV